MSAGICVGLYGSPCFKLGCWCGDDLYVHGFPDDTGYCLECQERIIKAEWAKKVALDLLNNK